MATAVMNLGSILVSTKMATRRAGDAVPFSSLNHIPLSKAYLCEDCHCVGNNSTQCPACASGALLGLSGIVNRGNQ